MAAGELEVSRGFVAGALHFVVGTRTTPDRQFVESLLGDLGEPVAQGERVMFQLLRESESGEGPWSTAGPRLDHATSDSLSAALTRLITGITLAALDAQPDSLHLHAAAATRHGGAVIICAARNTGKTTTVARLVERGWSYLTDETVELLASSSDVAGFPKPLSVKPGGLKLLGPLAAQALPRGEHFSEAESFVPVDATCGSIDGRSRPKLVVLLRRPSILSPGQAPTHRRVSPADAVVALMQGTLDAARCGPYAVDRLAELAARCSCYEIEIGDPSELAALIERLFDEATDPGLDVQRYPSSVAVAPSVVSLRIADRVVVHDVESGCIFALDEAARSVWEQIGGWERHSTVDLQGPVVAPFVGRLRSLGVLTSAASADALSSYSA